jgi:hypothetical protein
MERSEIQDSAFSPDSAALHLGYIAHSSLRHLLVCPAQVLNGQEGGIVNEAPDSAQAAEENPRAGEGGNHSGSHGWVAVVGHKSGPGDLHRANHQFWRVQPLELSLVVRIRLDESPVRFSPHIFS